MDSQIKQKEIIMLTQDHIDNFNRTRKEFSLKLAEDNFKEILKTFDNIEGSENLQKRKEIWKTLLAEHHGEKNAEIQKRETAAAKREERSRYVNKLCELVLSSSTTFSDRESRFLNDIKNKKTLTEKQASWLTALADRSSVSIERKIPLRGVKKYQRVQCDHEDLGSRGYQHGDYVKCPDCGKMTHVW